MKAVLVTLLVGCAAQVGPGPLRFANQSPALIVDDRHDIAKPAIRSFARTLYMLDVFFARSIPAALELEPQVYARDINALDDVPDSTWFTNRIGVRDLSAEDIKAGGRETFAAPKGPWVVTGTKVGGASPGFVVRDAAGAKFIMKFDSNGAPDMQTGADVVVQKLLWAIGFATPEDAIFLVRRDELTLGPTAKVEDTFGNKHKMVERDLDEVLAKVDHEPDGSYRVLVSRFLPGEPVGGYAQEGVREDDPNDRIAHEDRRTLRAQKVFFAWLASTDVKEDNGLDMWATDGGKHYLVHYLVDFGLSLGVYGWDQTDPGDQFAYSVDVKSAALSLVTLGWWTRPWEGGDGPQLRGVGRFESAHYDPLHWRDRYPYRPFTRVDPADGFWAAKIILRFTEPQLRAAVEEGHYKDPAAIDYLVRVLVERQYKTALAWFSLLSPFDHFKVTNDATLCFDDLLRVYFTRVPATTYHAAFYDYAGTRLGEATTTSTDPHACFTVALGGDHAEYTIAELSAERAGTVLPPVRVHLAHDPDTHDLRVIGIRRSQP